MAVFDPNVLAEVVGDDEDFVAEVLGEFLATAPEMMEDIRQAMDDGPGALVRCAHALKGACRSIGASALGQVCAALEAEARAGRLPPDRDEALDELTQAYETLVGVLRGRLAKAAA